MQPDGRTRSTSRLDIITNFDQIALHNNDIHSSDFGLTPVQLETRFLCKLLGISTGTSGFWGLLTRG